MLSHSLLKYHAGLLLTGNYISPQLEVAPHP